MSAKNPRFSIKGDGKHPQEPQPDQRKKQVVEALSKRYKELNELWEAAEDDLKQVPVPVDVFVCYKSEIADPHNDPLGERDQIHDNLGFVRSKGGWRICHGNSHDGFPDYEIDWKPITECSVDLRLEAVPHIGELRERVLKAAEECVPKLDKAIADLRSTVQGW
jgi:hypothetical protein